MAPIDYDDDIENADDNYRESSDDDFDPDSAPAEDPSSSEDEDNATSNSAQPKGKRKAAVDEDLDSGDELTIQAARKKRAKKKNKGTEYDNDDHMLLSGDNGDMGGLVKTRAQRKVERKERKPLARAEGATVDVNALWAQMIAAPLKAAQATISQGRDAPSGEPMNIILPLESIYEEEQVSVKKVYTFAGQDTTKEKRIPRSQLDKYLSDGWKTLHIPENQAAIEEKTPKINNTAQPKIRRPLRRPMRFDPNPTGLVRALALENQFSWPRKSITALQTKQENMPAPEVRAKPEKTQKLNVVDKSRMDWTGFVDKEGIAEELDTHGRTKEAYLGRMNFLADVEARREEERRNVKLKAAAAMAA